MLHVHEFGDPAHPPLVALHGVKGYGGRWRRLAEVGRRVYAPDLRGHGHSDWDPPWTMERFTADVVSTMDSLGLDRVDLAGHSFGGAVAVYVARLVPERVRRLVLVDPAVGVRPDVAGQHADDAVDPPSFVDVEEALAWRASRWPNVTDRTVIEDDVRGHLAGPSAGGAERSPRSSGPASRSALAGPSAGGAERSPRSSGPASVDGRYRFRYRPAAAGAVYSELSRDPVAPPAGVPTLILRAPREKIVRRHFLKICAAAGADVTLVDIDCGHMMLEERPDEVLAAVRSFLDP
jgi:lipase